MFVLIMVVMIFIIKLVLVLLLMKEFYTNHQVVQEQHTLFQIHTVVNVQFTQMMIPMCRYQNAGHFQNLVIVTAIQHPKHFLIAFLAQLSVL